MSDSTVEQPQFKTCSNSDCPCDNPQPFINFSIDRSRKDGRVSRCKTCVNAYCETWRKSHPDHSKKWREANPERYKEGNRRLYQSNAERYKATSRKRYYSGSIDLDKKREYDRRWRQSNIGKQRAKKYRREARLLNLPSAFNDIDWQHCLNYFNGCCAVCGRPAGLWHTLAADHWIPLSSPDCPGTIPTNIVPLCHGTGGCNNSKGYKSAETWLIEKFGKRNAAKILKRIKGYFDTL